MYVSRSVTTRESFASTEDVVFAPQESSASFSHNGTSQNRTNARGAVIQVI